LGVLKFNRNCRFSFVNNLYLIFHACVQTFDVTRVKLYRRKPNGALYYKHYGQHKIKYNF